MASQLLADGEAYRTERQTNAEGDTAYFRQVSEAFHQAPEVVAFTMYVDRLEDSLPALRKIVLSDDISSDTSGNTLPRFFMIGEFLKKGLSSQGQIHMLQGGEGLQAPKGMAQ